MEHGSEQLANMAISEISRTTKKISHEIENGSSSQDRTAEETIKEIEHMTKEAIKLAEIAASAIPKGWNGNVERNQEWEINC